jgi:hypothetical protein
MDMNAAPNEDSPRNSGEDWPYGFGMCCCGCGKASRVVDGVQQKFYQKYHERWSRAKLQRSSPSKKRQVIERNFERNYYPATDTQTPLPADQKRTRPNKFAIANHLPSAFNVSQSEINQAYADKDLGGSTASEREKLFPHLSAPTVELKSRFKKAVADEPEVASGASKQLEQFPNNENPERLKQHLAWIRANRPLLQAISRARDRATITVNSARNRNREKVDVEFRLLQRIRGRVSAVLNGKVKDTSTLRLLGCSLPEFRAHLEKQFKGGMSWQNYGEWHVDHIRPCASFDFSEPNSLSQCFHYANLQPMWGEDNARKSSRWDGKLIRRKKLD